MICALPFLMLVPPLPGIKPTADDIMCRVAENQERADNARKSYVYDMNVFVRLKRANGKLAREESRDYVVAPGTKGASRKLIKVGGRILEGKKEIAYAEAGYKTKDMDIDGALTDSFARELLWRRDSAGPMVGWFPLTPKRIAHYTFTYEGEERYRDYDVYKVSFIGGGDDDDCWSGEALIERTEFQPVLISTAWSCKIPGAVKILLGTDVQQIGAKITYQRFDRGVWFPVNCGGEMKLRVLFMYARTIAFSAKNAGFRKADVQTSVKFEDSEDQSPDDHVHSPIP
jgi:hypothetical protein